MAVGLALSLLWSSLAAGQQGPPGRPATPVRAVAVQMKLVQERRQVTGNLHALARSKVAAIEASLVVECSIQEGDVVQKGDMLARLDDRRLILDLQRIEAQEATARALVDERQAEVEIKQRDGQALRELAQRSASNPKELADAESEVQVALARKAQAERDVEVLNAHASLLRTRLTDMVVTAPFDGVIVSKNTEVGQWVGQGQFIAEIVSVGAYEAWLDVPQEFAAAVTAAGVRVGVEVRALRERHAPAAPRVIRQVDPIARSFPVVIRIEDRHNHLAQGMSVIGWVPTGVEGEHLMVPRDALLRNESGFFVYVARAMGGGEARSAVPTPISVLFEHEEHVAVRPGALEAGNLVITEGNERLLPMTPVSIIGAEPPAASGPPAAAGAPQGAGQ